MAWVADLESKVFDTGPKILLWLTAIFALTPLLLLINALFGSWEIEPGAKAKVLALASLSALMTLSLSWSLRRRHVVSVPLTWGLCLFGLLSLRGGFGSAIEGITPQFLLRPALWVVTGIELGVIAFAAVFVARLWRKGHFNGVSK